MKTVTFLTDFGTTDGYAAAMKGVVLTAHPDAQMVDVTHDIPAGNIRAGAWALRNFWNLFPKDTIHVAVVDPGVGSKRKPLLVRADGRWLIGPDNGLFSWVFQTARRRAAYRIRPEARRADSVGQTFHGRDVFAYAAGRLVAGIPWKEIADAKVDPVRFDWPRLKVVRKGICGEIIHIDRFGNAISTIPFERVAGRQLRPLISCNSFSVKGLSRFYASVSAGRALAVGGSSGLLELSVNQGDAAKLYKISPGDAVIIRW